MDWESGVGYGPVAGICEHGNEISGSISGVEFSEQRRINFQDRVYRREYSSVYFVYALCGRKAQAASDESLRRFPIPHRRSTVLPGCVSIYHTGIFVTVWRTTGRLSTRNRQWRRVYNSSRERDSKKECLLNRLQMKKPQMQVWRTSHQDLLYLITASAYKCCNLWMRQFATDGCRWTVEQYRLWKQSFVIKKITRHDIIKCHNIHGWFLNTSPDFRASNAQRCSSMTAWRGRQWADSFLANAHKHLTATCSSYGTSCFFVWNAPLSRRGYTRRYKEKAPTFVNYTTPCV